jgi:uncharacterized cupin superfamily protein
LESLAFPAGAGRNALQYNTNAISQGSDLSATAHNSPDDLNYTLFKKRSASLLHRVSKFPWKWTVDEKAYILEGEVDIYPAEGEPGEKTKVHVKAGDYCVFPGGMSCT